MPPGEVAARAKANGVDVWALTDHDEVGGIAEARAAAEELGLLYVTGVEISASWAGHTLHIVGLQIDETDETLIRGLAETRTGRTRRAHEMALELEKAGIPNAYEGALKYVGNPDLISRMHFARYISELGICSSPAEVFAKYLTSGKPGYVPHRWASLADAVMWIHGAGGISVLAHPGRYKLNETEFGALFDEYRQLGGMAMEVTTGSHTVEQYGHYAKIAQHYGFLASRGSDFHGPGESRVDLGNLPPLPQGVTPVWHDWAL
jgi:predicted metal-dependent phosphoesterase TrpH